MGTRFKTFVSTGVPPNGQLFAGDLNQIEDSYADLLNLSQNVGVSTLQIGESGLQLLRYGAGEARISGALRTDGILRALGGMFAGTFTTTQRDAIPLGSRPYGLVITNTTTNRLEWNTGTDASPNWQPVGPIYTEVPIGGTMEWSWAAASIPSWALLPYGQSLLKASYPGLDALASATGYVYGTDATHFTMPDHRGRVSVGKDDMGGAAANRITVGISGASGATLGAVFGAEGITLTTAQLPAHNHAITGAPGLTGSPALSGTPGHTLTLPSHVHINALGPGWHYTMTNGGGGNTPFAGGGTVMDSSQENTGAPTTLPAINGAITNGSLAAGIGTLAATAGTLATSNTGTGTVVQTAQPSIIVNKFMRAL